MIIVPIIGDQVKAEDGLTATVLGYSNYKPEGPAIIVDKTEEESGSMQFSEIVKINGQHVDLLKSDKGYNVFQTDGFMERQFQLPQPGDILSSDVSGVETRQYEVKRLRLHVKDKSARGLILDCEEQGSGDEVEISLGQITDIEHYIFNRKKFLSFYSEYCEKGAA